MKEMEYLRKCLILPILLPFFFYLLYIAVVLVQYIFHLQEFSLGLSEAIGGITGAFLIFLIIGGLPYYICSSFIYKWSFKTSISKIKIIAFIFPFIFSALYLPVFYFKAKNGVLNQYLVFLSMLQSYFVLVGYCYLYVIIAFVGLFILKKKGIIDKE